MYRSSVNMWGVGDGQPCGPGPLLCTCVAWTLRARQPSSLPCRPSRLRSAVPGMPRDEGHSVRGPGHTHQPHGLRQSGKPVVQPLGKVEDTPPCPGPRAPPCHLPPGQPVSKPSLAAFPTLPLEQPWRAPRLETAA